MPNIDYGVFISVFSIFVFLFLKIVVYSRPGPKEVLTSILEIPTDVSLFGFLLLLSSKKANVSIDPVFGSIVLTYLLLIIISIIMWKSSRGFVYEDRIHVEVKSWPKLSFFFACNFAIAIICLMIPFWMVS
jgi:hypothetical protein